MRPSCVSCTSRSRCILLAMEPEVFSRLASQLHHVWFQKGETIVHEGIAFTGWAILCHGQVRLTVSTEGGKRLLLHFCKPGDLLAASVFKPPSFSATAVSPCAVAFLTREHVLDFGRRYPGILLQVHQRFEEIQRHLARKLVDLAYRSVRQRLVHVLLHLREEHGVPGGRGAHRYPTFPPGPGGDDWSKPASDLCGTPEVACSRADRS